MFVTSSYRITRLHYTDGCKCMLCFLALPTESPGCTTFMSSGLNCSLFFLSIPTKLLSYNDVCFSGLHKTCKCATVSGGQCL